MSSISCARFSQKLRWIWTLKNIQFPTAYTLIDQTNPVKILQILGETFRQGFFVPLLTVIVMVYKSIDSGKLLPEWFSVGAVKLLTSSKLLNLNCLLTFFTEQLNVEIRGKRTFGTKYSIAKYKMFLGSLGLEKKKKV